MEPVEAYKSLGLISISVSWFVIGILVYRWRGNRSMSISKHAASHRHAYLMMGVLQTAVMPMFFLFIYKWFAPTFHLSNLFTVCVGLSALGFFLAAWIPDTKGWKGQIHGLGAYGAATLFVPAITIMCLSADITGFAKMLSYIGLGYFIFSITVFTAIEKARNYHLYVQVIYLMLFHCAILITAYAR